MSIKEMGYNSIQTRHEFNIAKKSELKLAMIYPQPNDTNDQLIVKLYKPNGELYRTNYYSHSLPNETELDLSNLAYFHVDLIAGFQHLECVYTHQGNDTTITLSYDLIPNQLNEVDLSLQ